MKQLYYSAIVLLALTVVVATVQTARSEAKPFRGQTLRGINVAMWMQPSAADFAKMKKWGANSIRLVLHADPQFPKNDHLVKSLSPFEADGESFLLLDKTIDEAGKKGLSVILDMHTCPGSESGAIWKDFTLWDSYLSLWAFIARRYKDNPHVIGYDLLNEPTIIRNTPEHRNYAQRMRRGEWVVPREWAGTPRDYWALMEKAAIAIRKIDPDITLIVEGAGLGGKPFNFLWMKPIKANNVVYSFHMYEPMEFGDAGKDGKNTDVSYSSRTGRKVVWDAMETVRKFSQKYDVPIYVGEFGLTYYSEGKGASEWLRDVLDYCEQNGWSWAYWSFHIKLRNPELVPGQDGSLIQRDDTERLSTLKRYWSKNKTR